MFPFKVSQYVSPWLLLLLRLNGLNSVSSKPQQYAHLVFWQISQVAGKLMVLSFLYKILDHFILGKTYVPNILCNQQLNRFYWLSLTDEFLTKRSAGFVGGKISANIVAWEIYSFCFFFAACCKTPSKFQCSLLLELNFSTINVLRPKILRYIDKRKKKVGII